MMSKGIFSLIELKYMFSTPAAPERQGTPEDSASVPRPTHAAALAILGERTGVVPELGERGFLKVGLPETANNHYIFLVERSILGARRVSSSSPVSAFFAFFAFFLVLYCCCATSCTIYLVDTSKY